MLSYFEATYARCAFPCFDEPSFRAKFGIKIAHEANGKLTALTNTCRDVCLLNINAIYQVLFVECSQVILNFISERNAELPYERC